MRRRPDEVGAGGWISGAVLMSFRTIVRNRARYGGSMIFWLDVTGSLLHERVSPGSSVTGMRRFVRHRSPMDTQAESDALDRNLGERTVQRPTMGSTEKGS